MKRTIALLVAGALVLAAAIVFGLGPEAGASTATKAHKPPASCVRALDESEHLIHADVIPAFTLVQTVFAGIAAGDFTAAQTFATDSQPYTTDMSVTVAAYNRDATACRSGR